MKNKLRASLLAFLLISSLTEIFSSEEKGMEYFKQAYRIEKTDPASAAALYRQAISEGLDRKVYNAARWRLYYIYKELDQFEEALHLLSTFGTGRQIEDVKKSITGQIAYYYGITYEAADQFAGGLLLNQQDPDRAFAYFQNALASSKKNYKLRNDIVKVLLRNGRDQDAGNLFAAASETPVDEMISRADILIGSKEWEKASSILRELSLETYELNSYQKYKILYLLGKIEKGKNNEHSAVVYFRQASRYDDESEGEYSVALASYSLYRQGNALSARGLLQDFPLSSDENIQLLQLVLMLEVDEDMKAHKKLKEQKEKFMNSDGFLAKKALMLVEKYDSKK